MLNNMTRCDEMKRIVCPKCNKEGCNYIDRQEVTKKIKGSTIVMLKRKRSTVVGKSASDTKKGEKVRVDNKARCKHCGWEGEL